GGHVEPALGVRGLAFLEERLGLGHLRVVRRIGARDGGRRREAREDEERTDQPHAAETIRCGYLFTTSGYAFSSAARGLEDVALRSSVRCARLLTHDWSRGRWEPDVTPPVR